MRPVRRHATVLRVPHQSTDLNAAAARARATTLAVEDPVAVILGRIAYTAG